MIVKGIGRTLAALLVGSLLALRAAPGWAIDAEAAEKLMKDNKCVKCHAIDRKKDAPAYRDIAAKYRGESDAETKLMHHVTSGEMVKFADGHEEHHKKVKAEDPAEIKNLIGWIMSLQGGTKY